MARRGEEQRFEVYAIRFFLKMCAPYTLIGGVICRTANSDTCPVNQRC